MLKRLGWLLPILAVACTGAPASTPATSPWPTSSLSPTAAHASSSPLRPSASPTAGASAAPSVAGSVSPVASPVGATDVVLRMYHSGGFLYPGASVDAPPTFTLYGDGTVIYRPSTVELIGAGPRGGGLQRALMNEEQMHALVRFALGPGGLAEARDRYTDVPIADAVTVNFIINDGGVSKSVAVYALGDEMEPGPETPHRERFKLLAELLGSFENEVERGNATAAGAFDPEAYRVTLIADEFGQAAVSAKWPWEDLDPNDFERDQSGFGIRVLTPTEAEPLFDLAAGEFGDPIVIGPDDVKYIIRYRPLLPDETP